MKEEDPLLIPEILVIKQTIREKPPLDNPTMDSDKWRAVEHAIYERAIAGTVSAQELYAKIKGKFIEKQEIKIGRIENDDYYRIRNQAKRELTERRKGKIQGDRKVLPESALLLSEQSLDTEQDEHEDSQVGSVAVSSSSSGGVSES